jgi:GT2 family glycosyltransferase
VDVSVIIVNWNTQELLEKCLRSIYAQNMDISYEVIVVDNASSDGSAAMVKERFADVVLIANQRNCGFAAANNQGLAVAKGVYVLLLNSDTVILNNAIGKAVALMPPDAAVLGARVLNGDGTLQPTCFMYPSAMNMVLSSTYLYKLFPKSRFFGRERMSWWGRDDARQVDVVTGCFMLVRREAIDEVGLLDERFFVYGEETDWCYRFSKAGWKVIFTPDIEIIHYGGASTRQMATAMSLQLRGSLLLFIKKHRNKAVYWFCCLLTAGFFLLRVPYWLVRSIISYKDRRYPLAALGTCLSGAMRCLRGAEKLCVEVQR